MPLKSRILQNQMQITSRGKLPLVLREDSIRRKGLRLLEEMGWRGVSVSLLIVSDRGISRIHSDYLGDASPTDVITFSAIEGDGPAADDGSGRVFIGDIVISWETARRQAREFGTSLEYEFFFYLCHGLLHLAGYDDRTSRMRKRMLHIQTLFLHALGLFPDKKPLRRGHR